VERWYQNDDNDISKVDILLRIQILQDQQIQIGLKFVQSNIAGNHNIHNQELRVSGAEYKLDPCIILQQMQYKNKKSYVALTKVALQPYYV